MIKLRPYQQTGIDDLTAALRRSKRKAVVFEMPTGGGKTVVFSYLAQRAVAKGSNVLILTDRKELLGGTAGTLEDFGLNPDRVRSGRKWAPMWSGKGGVVVAMAQTLKKRLGKQAWGEFFKAVDLVIYDEIHKQEFNEFFIQRTFTSRVQIGFSATPIRTGKQRQLGEDFDEIVHTLTVPELIDLGFLVPDMYYGSPLVPDMKGVAKNTKGDYSESAMFKKFDTPKIYGGAVEDWKKKALNTITLVFCSNIIHCVRTCKEFAKAGIKAKFLVSSLGKPKQPEGIEPPEENADPEWVKYWEKKSQYDEYNEAYLEYSGNREDILQRWKSGEFYVLVNAGILTTGFDHKPTETIVMLRATLSLQLWMQIKGRGSRISPETHKTHFNILDYGGNDNRHGSYRLRRQWYLWHEQKSGGGNAPMKECGRDLPADKYGKIGCGAFIFASAKVCEVCGYVYPEKKEEKKIELSLMTTDENGKLKATKAVDVMSFEELEVFCKAQNYKKNWINIQLWRRGGEAELKKYAEYKGYSRGWITKISSFIPASIKAMHEDN